MGSRVPARIPKGLLSAAKIFRDFVKCSKSPKGLARSLPAANAGGLSDCLDPKLLGLGHYMWLPSDAKQFVTALWISWCIGKVWWLWCRSCLTSIVCCLPFAAFGGTAIIVCGWRKGVCTSKVSELCSHIGYLGMTACFHVLSSQHETID